MILGLLLVIGIIGLLVYLNHKKIINLYTLATRLAVFITFGALLLVIGYILINGVPHLNKDMFALEYTSENVSMLPAILTTLIVVFLAIILATPIGIFTAIYLVEYAEPKSLVVEIIRLAAETLQGIPSIVYGLFGMMFFVESYNLGYSVIAGVLTISIMILPIIIRSVEEALLSVPQSMRDGSYALGAGKLRTIFRIVVPVAMPGILSAVVLATGRIVGETAALQFTLGTATSLVRNLFTSSRTLSLHMYILATEGLHVGEAYATATVLLVVVLIINHISTKIGERFSKL